MNNDDCHNIVWDQCSGGPIKSKDSTTGYSVDRNSVDNDITPDVNIQWRRRWVALITAKRKLPPSLWLPEASVDAFRWQRNCFATDKQNSSLCS